MNLCPKCNVKNDANSSNCIDCGFSLTARKVSISENSNSEIKVEVEDNFSKTIQTIPCAECGYPLIDLKSACPQCNAVAIKQNNVVTEILEPPIHDVRSTVIQHLNIQEPNKTVKIFEFKETEAPHQHQQCAPKLILKAVTLNGESHSNVEIFNDTKIITREDIDSGDNSISSNGHSEVSLKNGEWQLKNIASNKANFVQVEDVVPLKNGMIIMIGRNKFFEILIQE